MNSLRKSSKRLESNISKTLGKSAGVSTNKMSSMIFLFFTIIITLLLSGIAFLVTRKPATLPVIISEGMSSDVDARPDETKQASTTNQSLASLSNTTATPSVHMDISNVDMPSSNETTISSLKTRLNKIQTYATSNSSTNSDMTQKVLNQIATEAIAASSDVSKLS